MQVANCITSWCKGREGVNFKNTIRLVEQGLNDDVFPCAAYAIGNKQQVFFKNSIGYKALYPQKSVISPNTSFDVSSLSKIMSTTMVALKAVESGRICLDDKLHHFFPVCYDKSELTIRNLLTHTSGITAEMPLSSFGIKPHEAMAMILKSPYRYKADRETVYSCVGYILLGEILQKVYDCPLDEVAQKYVFTPLEMADTTYKPSSKDIASTDFCKDIGDYACGIVYDDNARFLGGVAGNSGVFSTLDDTIKFATMLASRGEGFLMPATFEMAVKNHTKSFSESRGLGFLLTGDRHTFAGDLLSEGSYGHTGTTGCSIIVDNKTGIYAILLTNRVHFGKENDGITRFRKLFHNSIYGSL